MNWLKDFALAAFAVCAQKSTDTFKKLVKTLLKSYI